GHSYGTASSISLGLLFGAVPVAGSLLGMPLDVRHMTLSTGALVMAVCSLGLHAAWQAGLFSACVGIGIVTALNLGVPFVMGLLVSLRARGLDRSVLKGLLQPA